MARNTGIAWTDHTWNPWIGCSKVSAGCDHCYAERQFGGGSRYARSLGMGNCFGPNADRYIPKTCNVPAWNRAARRAGVRRRVFVGSLCDLFEDRRDLDSSRTRVGRLIAESTDLDFLLLTKRPQHVSQLVPWGSHWPTNVWLGVTAEDQRTADERIPLLVGCPAVVRFVSAEPLLGPLDLSRWSSQIDWIIVGGESGPKQIARPMIMPWVRALCDQSRRMDIPLFLKQWGDSVDRPTDISGAGDATIPTPDGPRHMPTLDGMIWGAYPSPRLHRVDGPRSSWDRLKHWDDEIGVDTGARRNDGMGEDEFDDE